MTQGPARTTRVLPRSQERLTTSALQVQGIAKELLEMDPQKSVQIAAEVGRLGTRLGQLASQEVPRLDQELQIKEAPSLSGRELQAVGRELSQLGMALAQVGLALDRASLQVRERARSERREDPGSFRLLTQGTEVGNEGFTLSHISRQLLQMGEEQLRFLRRLLDQGRRTRRAPRPPRKRASKPAREEVWGGIESEDLVRKAPRKSESPADRRRTLDLEGLHRK
jgi:hypothetical protein